MANGFVRVAGTEVTKPDGTPLVQRGMGLGMWLVPEGYMFRFKGRYERPRTIAELVSELLGPDYCRAYWPRFREAFFTEADAKALVEHGFDTIRIPFDYKLLSPEQFPGTYLKEGFGVLDNAIEVAGRHGLYVILDMHCAPGGQTGHNIDDSWGDYPWLFESADAKRQTADIWRKLAERYADNPVVMGYDLLNEPLPEARKDYWPQLEPLYRDIIAAIREVDRNHIIFVEGGNWATNFSMMTGRIDENMVFAFHKYWNENNIQSIQHFLDLRSRFGVPLWLGETGENNVAWYRGFRDLVESQGIGWNFWPWKKMVGGSSPYTILDPPHWEDVIAYTNGGPKPTMEAAREAFEGLLANIRLENCRMEPGVINALTGE